MNIEDLQLIDRILDAEEDIYIKSNKKIINVSNWDPSKEFQEIMNRVLEIPVEQDLFSYKYTYTIDPGLKREALHKLGLNTAEEKKAFGLFFQSSTIAIINIINYLSISNYKKICILQPSYFSVKQCCYSLSLNCKCIQMEIVDNVPQIPIGKIIDENFDCLWITSPVLSTGFYYNEQQTDIIKNLMTNGITIVFDESMSYLGLELIRKFGINENVFYIYSPHKSICINGFKFSVIICSKKHQDVLEQWVDIFSGGLSISNVDAISHFVSSNFESKCIPVYNSFIGKNKDCVCKIANNYPFLYYLNETIGHYLTIFTKKRCVDEEKLFNLIYNLISKKNVSFIPGYIDELYDENCINFRINLTLDSKNLEYAVNEIFESFNSY